MAEAQCTCEGGEKLDLDCEECVNKAVADGTCQKCTNVRCPQYSDSLYDLLVQAARNGKTKSMETLLKAGVNINCVVSNQWTPLTAAANCNQIEAVRLLVNWSAQVGQSNGRECSTDLSKSDNPECSANVNQSDDKECSLSINKPGCENVTAFCRATYYKYWEIAEILVQAGADVHCKDINGYQPIHNAAEYGHTGMIKLLVEAGSDVNSKGKNGDQAIHLAARYGHMEIMEVLLEYGADVHCKDSYGEQPIHYAAEHGHTGIIELLLQAGVSVDTEAPRDKETALLKAANEGHTQTVQFLISKGADVEMQDAEGYRPLHCAAGEGHVDTVAALIHAGASIDPQNNDMQTPLIYSFDRTYSLYEKDNTQIVKMLLQAGADLRFEINNYSALGMAISNFSGSAKLMAFLYAAGASMCPGVRDSSKYKEIIPKFIIDDQEPMLDLQGLCRRKIRAVLLSPAWGNQKYLSSAIVAQLPLPERLKKSLLFSVDV